jgi:hypothetical protein
MMHGNSNIKSDEMLIHIQWRIEILWRPWRVIRVVAGNGNNEL